MVFDVRGRLGNKVKSLIRYFFLILLIVAAGQCSRAKAQMPILYMDTYLPYISAPSGRVGEGPTEPCGACVVDVMTEMYIQD